MSGSDISWGRSMLLGDKQYSIFIDFSLARTLAQDGILWPSKLLNIIKEPVTRYVHSCSVKEYRSRVSIRPTAPLFSTAPTASTAQVASPDILEACFRVQSRDAGNSTRKIFRGDLVFKGIPHETHRCPTFFSYCGMLRTVVDSHPRARWAPKVVDWLECRLKKHWPPEPIIVAAPKGP